MYRILAVETSCDETAVSILETEAKGSVKGLKVLAHLVESQIEIHRAFGGVVPEVAARDHLTKIHPLVEQALERASLTVFDLDELAVTLGPGLIGALMVGTIFMRGFAIASGLPLIGVNHIDAHLMPAFFIEEFQAEKFGKNFVTTREPVFPCLGLTVSGGHCLLSKYQSLSEKEILGWNVDDACGEAFDKVAKILGFDYPGGPVVEKLARGKRGIKDLFKFPYRLSKNMGLFHFSYSGLKTAVMNAVQKEIRRIEKDLFDSKNVTNEQIKKKEQGKGDVSLLSSDFISEITWSFQEAAFLQLIERVKNAFKENPSYHHLFIAGGVAQNERFRSLLTEHLEGINVFFAPVALCSDNATMIALSAIFSQCDGLVTNPFSRYKFS